jgi:large subunit ribosomal protein L9
MTQVILLEKVDHLGAMGDTVSVKAGFARNYLLPQGKALRATQDNVTYFEAQKSALEAENEKKRKAAEAEAKKLDGLTVALIRQASESGQLYGSVSARDIADVVTGASDTTVTRGMVELNQNFKMIGLFPVSVALHPEVKVEVTINIARSNDEAKIQAETGKALITGMEEEDEQPSQEELAAQAEEVFEEGAAPEAEELAAGEEAPAEETAEAGEEASSDDAEEKK